ncbi:MAG: leucyl aminopeptidase family protein [Alphaproteobacteria bacterium]|nr:leucyl aminopeptidase family protein [Alphaproteobacteria bacterium]
MSVFATKTDQALRLRLVTTDALDAVLSGLSEAVRPLAANFKAKPGDMALLPADGDVDALLGLGAGDDVFALGAAAMRLPEGDWAIEALPAGFDPTLTAIAWGMGAYQFTRYKSASRAPARLVLPDGADAGEAERVVDAAVLTRDLVNTPADAMGPEGLEAAFRALAERHGADVRVTAGEALIEENYPMIHAVGRAAGEAPRLLELEWGDQKHPRIALVGKGVCFDSGGLDLKAAQFMRLMKKDMGGAANAMGLAHMIMDAKLPVRLHLLIPAVENAVSAGAFRPGDILSSRQGLTVEIDNTDAEGRLVLGDALTRACEDAPELLLDFATLTGAARVALGPEVMPFYTDDDALAEAISEGAQKVKDPVWRMPLWDNYAKMLDSKVADIVNGAASPFAGSITAALFLKRFAGETRWAHFDIFAWNPSARPGHPEGGEIQAVRGVYQFIRDAYPH